MHSMYTSIRVTASELVGAELRVKQTQAGDNFDDQGLSITLSLGLCR